MDDFLSMLANYGTYVSIKIYQQSLNYSTNHKARCHPSNRAYHTLIILIDSGSFD
jgi:hypothetical protein